MGTTTPRLGLYKAAPVGEQVDVQSQINAAYDKVDEAIGARVVTSGTRPASPYIGQIIFESDTGYTFLWNGTLWYPIGMGSTLAYGGYVDFNSVKIANNTALAPVTVNLPFKYDIHAEVLGQAGFETVEVQVGWLWEKTAGSGILDASGSPPSVIAHAAGWTTFTNTCALNNCPANENQTFQGLVQVSGGSAYFRGRVSYRIVPRNS